MIDLLDLNLFYRKAYQDSMKALQIIREAMNSGLSANKTLSILKEEGLGYKRQDFLADFSLMKATDKAKSIEGYQRAKTYYEKVRELMKIRGYRNMTEAYKYANAYTKLNAKTVEEIEEAQYLQGSGLGSSLFGEAYPLNLWEEG